MENEQFDLSDAKDVKDLFYLFLYVVSDKQELEGTVKGAYYRSLVSY